MQVKYGTYTHDDNECWLTITKTPLLSAAGARRGFTERWVIRGVKVAANQAALTTALAALELAYSVNQGDLSLLTTQHVLTNANTTGGTRVVSLRYPDSRRTEYVYQRTFEVVVEGDILDSAITVLSWHESIQRFGTGGAEYRILESISGIPQKQQIKAMTKYFFVQSGHAVGHFSYPFPATPLWPDDEHVSKHQIKFDTPRFALGNTAEYPVSWRYVFESASQLQGDPTPIP